MADTPKRTKRAGARRRSTARARRRPDELRGRLRPHDPFELIRWLALSQPDPRKALAELVQNSLDAAARRIRITRRRERRAPCLFIFDDGEGIIPELGRAEALKYIATHIGHSRKRSLSPQQRLELMTQGQYGIGLLGFWSLGQTLELRSAVPGERPHRLILHRDRPDYRIEPMRGRLDMDERWTEVVVVGLHREAQSALLGRRAADYLGSELRGQLLARPVELIVEDRMSRGTAQKVIAVRPPKFIGERLEGIGPLDVPGHPPVRFEVYLSAGETRDGEPRGLAVYSAGTLVAESFHDLAPLGLDRPPWIDSRLSGIVDWPAFRVSPGSRRGIVPDAAASAFAGALALLEPILSGVLEALERRRIEELDRTIIRDLQRAFRDFHRQRPRYSMLPVERPAAEPAGSAAGPAAGEEGASTPAVGPGVVASGEEPPPRRDVGRAELLPPGPLQSVRLTPATLRVECHGRRRVRAHALDATGRGVEDPVEYEWSVRGDVGTLEREGQPPHQVLFAAGANEANGTLCVVARSGESQATAEADVEVLAEIAAGRGGEGIPEPVLVHHPGALWRSRMHDGRWEVNTGHRDFRAVAERPALKLRYLAMLFAKEIVVQSHNDPRLAPPLEQLVEIAGYADRRLSTRGRKTRPAEDA